MPELPEVEMVRRVLTPHLKGKIIENVKIINTQVIAAPSPEKFTSYVKGQTIVDFLRRGKFLRLALSGGDYLTLHMRMTGCLTIEPYGTPCEKHTHLIFELNDGSELRYDDTRRLGKFWYTEQGARDESGAEKLGVEPLSGKLTAQYLRIRSETSKKTVKAMLLDQSIVAGIGNIYSDEILFTAHIRPDKPCSALSDKEFERLASVIPERLEYFIDKNAMSFREYSLGKGRDYRNTPYLQVYGKAGTHCPVCGDTLQRTVLSGRSSVFCFHCQN